MAAPDGLDEEHRLLPCEALHVRHLPSQIWRAVHVSVAARQL